MKTTARHVAIFLLFLVALMSLLSAFLLRKYSYFDYHEENCKAGPIKLKVELIGSFDNEGAWQKASPYYIRVEIAGGGGGEFFLDDMKLKSVSSATVIGLDSARRVEVNREGDIPTVVYIEDYLQLKYEDYVLGGVVAAKAGGDMIYFRCELNRSYREEWRIPIIDALMSV